MFEKLIDDMYKKNKEKFDESVDEMPDHVRMSEQNLSPVTNKNNIKLSAVKKRINLFK